MSIVLTVDIDKENQNVHISEENGSGAIYHMANADDVVTAVKDYLEEYVDFGVTEIG